MTSYDEPFNSDPYHGNRRSKLEMILCVLGACQSPVLQTRIMYKTNVNCKVGKEIVNVLVARGFVKAIPKTKNRLYYKATHRGLAFLSKFEELKQLWDSSEPEESVQVQMEEAIKI